MFSKKEKLIILVSCIICVVVPMIFTIDHIFFYNQEFYSPVDYISQKYILVQVNSLRVISFIYFISLLTMIYFVIKKIIYNRRRFISTKFFKALLILITFYAVVYSPLGVAYSLGHPSVGALVVFWDIIHFIGIAFILAFLFRVISEN
ncbi:MAG: hypothetical protein GY756_01730 [bacterium]|nr:hypothetical protein [bacterium]